MIGGAWKVPIDKRGFRPTAVGAIQYLICGTRRRVHSVWVQLRGVDIRPLWLQRAPVPFDPRGVSPVIRSNGVPHPIKLVSRGHCTAVGDSEWVDWLVAIGSIPETPSVLPESCRLAHPHRRLCPDVS
jgi:hypothetical protein